jgi:hypothetical protein
MCAPQNALSRALYRTDPLMKGTGMGQKMAGQSDPLSDAVWKNEYFGRQKRLRSEASAQAEAAKRSTLTITKA